MHPHLRYESRDIFPEDDAWGQPILRPRPDPEPEPEPEPVLSQDAPPVTTDPSLDGAEGHEGERAASVATPTPEVPPPRPCFPAVSFAVGGKLVITFPTGTGHYSGAMDNAEAMAGKVGFHALSDFVSDEDGCVARHGSFPGPLSVEGTTRSAVISYAKARAEEAEVQTATMEDAVEKSHRSSWATLWRLLSLLCKHTGQVPSWQHASQAENTDPVAVDIAELLVAGGSADESVSGVTGVDDVIESPGRGEADNDGRPAQRAEAVLAVQTLLLRGSKAEACEKAASSGLWEHALILAQQIGVGLYKKTLQR